MRIGNYQFRPRIIPALVTLVLLPVLISLGFWQLSRTEEKREILAQQEAKSQLPPLAITAEGRLKAELEFRRLSVSGKYLPRFLILVDNKVHQGQVGYFVVMPFQIEGTDSAVLVNRGWVRGTGRREVLPDINTPAGKLTLQGTAKFNTKDIVSFTSQNRLDQTWPALVRWVDIAELDEDIPFKLKPFLLLQAPEENEDYVRDWKFVNSPPEKNLSYAVQWFTLAAALFLIFIIVNTKKSN
jgi:surfeit locus 1 family protein